MSKTDEKTFVEIKAGTPSPEAAKMQKAMYMRYVDITTDADTETVLSEVPKTELEKLVVLIEEKHPEWNVEVTDIGVWLWVDEKCVYDVVCHLGTYGYSQGLLEGWTGNEKDDTEGFLTAEMALKRFEKALKDL